MKNEQVTKQDSGLSSRSLNCLTARLEKREAETVGGHVCPHCGEWWDCCSLDCPEPFEFECRTCYGLSDE